MTISCSNVGRFYLNEETGEWVDLRIPAFDDLMQLEGVIAKRHVHYVQRDGQYFPVEGVDLDRAENEQNLLLWNILDWKLMDTSWRDIPCTDETKLLLLDNPEFSAWVKKHVKVLAEQCEVRAKLARENIEAYVDRQRKDLDCETCRRVYELSGVPFQEDNCIDCWPELMPENVDAFKVWAIVSGQRILSGMGQTIDINQLAVWRIIDELKIKNRFECFLKVMQIARYSFRKEHEEWEMKNPRKS